MEDEMAITGTLCLEKVNKSTLFEGFWCLTPLSIIFQLFRVYKLSTMTKTDTSKDKLFHGRV
jgi:hypothetical protein